MMSKHILIWSVCMVICGLAAVPVARAEQPIIIPVVLVVTQAAGQANSMSRPEVQTALYRIQDVGSPPRAAASTDPVDSGNAAAAGHGALPDNLQASRVVFHTGNHVRLNVSGPTRITLPVVLKVVIDGKVATNVSIDHVTEVAQERETKGPLIPAVDLLTGRPTTVRPEYIEEYQRIVRSGRK